MIDCVDYIGRPSLVSTSKIRFFEKASFVPILAVLVLSHSTASRDIWKAEKVAQQQQQQYCMSFLLTQMRSGTSYIFSPRFNIYSGRHNNHKVIISLLPGRYLSTSLAKNNSKATPKTPLVLWSYDKKSQIITI